MSCVKCRISKLSWAKCYAKRLQLIIHSVYVYLSNWVCVCFPILNFFSFGSPILLIFFLLLIGFRAISTLYSLPNFIHCTRKQLWFWQQPILFPLYTIFISLKRILHIKISKYLIISIKAPFFHAVSLWSNFYFSGQSGHCANAKYTLCN